MTNEVKEFLSRLKSVKEKAFEERITVQAIYSRIRKGIYETVEIGGITFIVEPKNNEE